jgi:hypothetical protein
MTDKPTLEDSTQWLYNTIANSKNGLAIAKIGSFELNAIIFYLRRKQSKEPYPEEIRLSITVNNGLWEIEDLTLDESIDVWAHSILKALEYMDGISPWNPMNPLEEMMIIRNCCPQAKQLDLLSLEPYYTKDKEYSLLMTNGPIAVISPFAKSIKQQWEKRDKLFPGHMWSKEQKIIPIQAFYGPYLNRFGGLSYPTEVLSKGPLAAVDYYVNEVKKSGAKYCFVGITAIAILIVAELKKSGIIAIHTGGATQIMFGVKGMRWKQMDFFRKLFNDEWVDPLSEETPTEAKRVEGGCFW